VQASRLLITYNLAAQSHVPVSFETAEYTANADAVGTLRLLEAIRILKMEQRTRFYQASTSELYGKVMEIPAKAKAKLGWEASTSVEQLCADIVHHRTRWVREDMKEAEKEQTLRKAGHDVPMVYE